MVDGPIKPGDDTAGKPVSPEARSAQAAQGKLLHEAAKDFQGVNESLAEMNASLKRMNAALKDPFSIYPTADGPDPNKPAEKAGEKPAEKTREKDSDKAAKKPDEKPAEKKGEKTGEKTITTPAPTKGADGYYYCDTYQQLEEHLLSGVQVKGNHVSLSLKDKAAFKDPKTGEIMKLNTEVGGDLSITQDAAGKPIITFDNLTGVTMYGKGSIKVLYGWGNAPAKSLTYAPKSEDKCTVTADVKHKVDGGLKLAEKGIGLYTGLLDYIKKSPFASLL